VVVIKKDGAAFLDAGDGGLAVAGGHGLPHDDAQPSWGTGTPTPIKAGHDCSRPLLHARILCVEDA
jgi:hypothetical protein